VTEAVTGVDLVEWQFRVAAGEKLPLTQADIRLKGHAVEARLYAEDPERGFLPSAGKLAGLRLPSGEGIRVDTGVEEDDRISGEYDPMIAKVIAHAPSREGAFNRLAHALAHTIAVGPRVNVAFLHALAELPAVRDGKLDTGLIEREAGALHAVPQASDLAAAARAAEYLVGREQDRLGRRARLRSNEKSSPWSTRDGFGFPAGRETDYALDVDGARMTARVSFGADRIRAAIDGVRAADCPIVAAGEQAIAWHKGRQTVVMLASDAATESEHEALDGVILAPMHGKVIAVHVRQGERVTKGQPLAVIEAMKMEHALVASRDGEVAEIVVSVGDQVAERGRIAVIKERVEAIPE
jgi:3-methylcrotonyl-CoA carboxylase alpha subunit